jgi:taurine dioxygenase
MSLSAEVLNRSALAQAQRYDLNNHIGTELRGLSLLDISDTDVEEIKKLIAERGVLVFRDQRMNLEQQLEMGRRFGPLHVHPAFADKDHAEALRIHADANSRYAAGEAWHTDVSCDEAPPAISMLRIEVTPKAGGDTAFASMYAAFETLSKPLQTFLLSLEAVHAGDLPWRGSYKSKAQKDFPVNTHPVVCTHPISMRNALYVNTGFTDKIKGLSARESKALLNLLFDHIAYGIEFQCRVRWEPHTLTMWDNRCTQHYASWDYFPQTRSGWRVTTAGARPFLQPG